MILSFEQFNENRITESKLQAEYQKFFKETLAKYNVKDEGDLSKEDKIKFFSEIEDGWIEGKGRKESKED